MATYRFSAIITKEKDWFVARCLDIDVTSQGKTVEEARANLKEAVGLYIESFGDEDIPQASEPMYMPIEVDV